MTLSKKLTNQVVSLTQKMIKAEEALQKISFNDPRFDLFAKRRRKSVQALHSFVRNNAKTNGDADDMRTIVRSMGFCI